MTTITRRHALATLAAGHGCCARRAASPGADDLDRLHLRAGGHTGAGARCLSEIVERVSKETNGGFQLKYHLGGALTIKGTDITTAVGDNVIQIGDDGFQQGNVPITGILRLPMLITNPQEFEKALAVMKPYVDRGLRQAGLDRAGDLLFPGADRLVEQEARPRSRISRARRSARPRPSRSSF